MHYLKAKITHPTFLLGILCGKVRLRVEMIKEIKPQAQRMRNIQVSDENSDAISVGERLRHAMKKAGGNKVVAEKSGVPVGSLNHYVKGRAMGADTAIHVARACGVPIEWLIFGESAPNGTSSSPTSRSNDEAVSFYEEAEASAGFGRLGIDAPAPRKVFISRDFLEELGLTPHHTIILKVAGDSMEPTLKGGDRLLLNTT
ncbi:MAG: S24 family peptidase, partial [Acetobacter persici]